ncbi:MAG: ABC transporter ATP-binding protein [Promethearchaeota archaeon]
MVEVQESSSPSDGTKSKRVVDGLDIDEYSIIMKNASVEYTKGKRVLWNVTLTARKGEVLGLIGGSGAGKSTCMRVMTGQIVPTSGYAITAGYDVLKENDGVVKNIGYVPQIEHLSLYMQFNAIDNCVFFGRQYGLPPEEIEEKAVEIMGILGFETEDLMRKPVRYLSGGERKRVSVAVGLVHDPEVLFLDEPTTGLDPHLRISVLNFLHKINKQMGTTIVIVSHDLEIADYCTKVALLDRGRLVTSGHPRELVQSLPSEGRFITLKFESLSVRDIARIKEKVPYIKYVLLAVRNKIKVSMDDVLKNRQLLRDLYAMGLTPTRYAIDTGSFLDFFRIKGRMDESERENTGEN